MFTAALFTVANKWNQSKCSSAGKCVNKCSKSTPRGHSASEGNEAPIQRATRVNVENTIHAKRKQPDTHIA